MTKPFDWRNPDYVSILAERARRLTRLRESPELLAACRLHYTSHPIDFVRDWGMTLDPRLTVRGMPSLVPFCPWPRQVEAMEFILTCWRKGVGGLVEKARDSGMSWCAIALACTQCLFIPGFAVGVVSRKLELVDQYGSADSLFEKARIYLENLPPEFLNGWTRGDAPQARIFFSNGSMLRGEGGSNALRGSRCAWALIDEAAFIDQPELLDAALSQATPCRIDVSTPNGRANSFALRRFSGKIAVFSHFWYHDPRKDQAWLELQKRELTPVVLAQECLVDYNASAEGVLIPAAWVQSAIGAHLKLGIFPTGVRTAALDVADGGQDKNAVAGRHGILLEHLESWSGANSDIYASVVRTFALCDRWGYDRFAHDAIGMGASVRGDARTINEKRQDTNLPHVWADEYVGSSAPPDGRLMTGRENADAFANLKAFSWWSLMERFRLTHQVVAEGRQDFDVDSLISLAPDLPELEQLCAELSQVQWTANMAGKTLIVKTPPGCRSPNLADAVCVAFSPESTASRLALWLRLADAASPEEQREQAGTPERRRAFAEACAAYRKRIGLESASP